MEQSFYIVRGMSDERDEVTGISYEVQPGRKSGWNVIRRNYFTGEKRVVAHLLTEYGAHRKLTEWQLRQSQGL